MRFFHSLLFLIIFNMINSGQAMAHAVVTHSTLDTSSIVPRKATDIELTFNSKVEINLSQVFLVSAGDKKQKLLLKPGAKPGHVLISVPALIPGEYAIQLKILAADGHLSDDLIRFIVNEER